MTSIDRGYTHLYTGNGKGKTTAALGLALRAAGAGLRTLMIQFMKGQHYSELDAVKMLDGHIVIEQYGSPDFCRPGDGDISEHYRNAQRGVARAREALHEEGFSIIILDEIVTALLFKLLTLEEIIELIRAKPSGRELVLTGRGAPEKLFEHCDLVTEMREIRHYYESGVPARAGIEH